MLQYIKGDLTHNTQTIIKNPQAFIEDLAQRKQYQIAKDMGLTSTQMSFLVSIFWALKPLEITLSNIVKNDSNIEEK